MKTLRVRTLGQWRNWLTEHHASESEVWLIFYKRPPPHTGPPTAPPVASIDYKDALDEALCFGWVDSLVKRLDDRRYARKFTPRRVMHGIWGAGQMSWTKTVVVVDEDVDVHDTHAVLRAVGERCVPARDSEMVHGPIDILDHAAPFLGAGTKIGLDATRKLAGAEEFRCATDCGVEMRGVGDTGGVGGEWGEWGVIEAVVGEHARASEARVRAIPGVTDARIPDELGGWWLLVRIEKKQAGDGARLIKTLGGLTQEMALPRWTLVLGPAADLSDLDGALFHWTANTSPERDRHLSKCGRRVAFDATPKMPGDERDGWPVRDWPPLMTMDEATKKKVTERWEEYGVG